MGRRMIKINRRGLRKNGRAIGKTGAAPCCCDCLYYRAVRCNFIVCSSEPSPDIFICKDLSCDCFQGAVSCPPCDGRPIENGMIVRYGQFCYKISTEVTYCPPLSIRAVQRLVGRALGRGPSPGGPDPAEPGEPGTDPAPPTPPPCVPLPNGAIVPAAGEFQIDCCKDCNLVNGCPIIDGWFPAVPCPCPGNGALSCVVYVKCFYYFQSIGMSVCPVWAVDCPPNGVKCFTVRPSAIPTPDLPPGAIGVERVADYANCCACCGGNSLGCCRETFTPYNINYATGVRTDFPAVECCFEKVSTAHSGSYSLDVYEYLAFDPPLVCLKFTERANVVGGSVVRTRVEYNVGGSATECPTAGTPNTDTIPIGDCTNADTLLSMLRGGNFAPGGGQVNTGSKTAGCTAASESGMADNFPFGFRFIFAGTASVTSNEGCGNVNCQPGGLLAPEMPGGSGGCSGCGKEGL